MPVISTLSKPGRLTPVPRRSQCCSETEVPVPVAFPNTLHAMASLPLCCRWSRSECCVSEYSWAGTSSSTEEAILGGTWLPSRGGVRRRMAPGERLNGSGGWACNFFPVLACFFRKRASNSSPLRRTCCCRSSSFSQKAQSSSSCATAFSTSSHALPSAWLAASGRRLATARKKKHRRYGFSPSRESSTASGLLRASRFEMPASRIARCSCGSPGAAARFTLVPAPFKCARRERSIQLA
mmetsp:Transcript_98285/g.278242  ORF Transcript_98285/g.278242 Transcript_98285/m.278242 type:complete len:239 (-) Transcript_98285:2368-3084(-)